MLQRAGLDEEQVLFDTQLHAGSTGILVRFGPIIPADTSWLPPGYTLTSLSEEIQDIESRTDMIREGMSYLAPSMSPMIIRAGIYKVSGNEQTLLAELNALEQAAFGSLINNKLSADESFRIFTDFISRVRNELSTSGRRESPSSH